MSFYGILENILSDVIIILLAILVGWLWIHFTNRYKLQNFFQTTNSKRLVIYLSNIRVLSFGAIGILGKKMSYQGIAVPYGEMQIATQIQNLFGFIIPKLVEISQYIGTLLLSDVKVQIMVSPMEVSKIEIAAPIISLGSSAYNVVSSYIEKLEENIVHFESGSTTLEEIQDKKNIYPIPSGSYSDTDPAEYDKPVNMSNTVLADISTPFLSGAGTSSFRLSNRKSKNRYKIQDENRSSIHINGLPPITDTNYGFIEKIKDKDGRCYFYVAGLSEFATKSAAAFLATKWLSLHKKYKKNKSFLVMLKFDNGDSDKYTTVIEREL